MKPAVVILALCLLFVGVCLGIPDCEVDGIGHEPCAIRNRESDGIASEYTRPWTTVGIPDCDPNNIDHGPCVVRYETLEETAPKDQGCWEHLYDVPGGEMYRLHHEACNTKPKQVIKPAVPFPKINCQIPTNCDCDDKPITAADFLETITPEDQKILFHYVSRRWNRLVSENDDEEEIQDCESSKVDLEREVGEHNPAFPSQCQFTKEWIPCPKGTDGDEISCSASPTCTGDGCGWLFCQSVPRTCVKEELNIEFGRQSTARRHWHSSQLVTASKVSCYESDICSLMTFNPSICTVKAKPGFGKSKGEYAMPVEEWTDRVLYLSCPKNMFTSTVPEVRVRAYLACEPYHAPDDPCVVLDSCTIYYAPYFTKCRLNTDLIREEQEDLAYILMVVFA